MCLSWVVNSRLQPDHPTRSGFWTPVESTGLPTPEVVILFARRGGSKAIEDSGLAGKDLSSLSPFLATDPKNPPVTPLVATDPKIASRKSNHCHTYDTPPGGLLPPNICNRLSDEPSVFFGRNVQPSNLPTCKRSSSAATIFSSTFPGDY